MYDGKGMNVAGALKVVAAICVIGTAALGVGGYYAYQAIFNNASDKKDAPKSPQTEQVVKADTPKTKPIDSAKVYVVKP